MHPMVDSEIVHEELVLEICDIRNKESPPKRRRLRMKLEDLPVLKEPGTLVTFGQGEVGQLGLGPQVIEAAVPTVVPFLDPVIQVCAGGMHTVCLTHEGKVVTFGCNDEGALGRSTDDDGSDVHPGYVELPGKAVQVSAGDSHSAALLEDGRVFAWGAFRDSCGTMGLTVRGTERLPISMLPAKAKNRGRHTLSEKPESVSAVRVASGSDHLAILSDDGKVFTCGNPEQGQLGRVAGRSAHRDSRRGLPHILIPQPVSIAKPGNVVLRDVWAGAYCTFAKADTTDDTEKIYACGLNNHCQLGFKERSGRVVHFFPLVSEFFSANNVKQIATADHHTLMLNDRGELYVVGRKEYGRLGLGENCPDANVPTKINSLKEKKIRSIACGPGVSLAVTTERELYGWGSATSRQLCSENDIHEPKKIDQGILGSSEVLAATAGGQHVAVIIRR